MEEKHYISMIEVHTANKVYRKDLKPGDAPEAMFRVKADKVLLPANTATCTASGKQNNIKEIDKMSFRKPAQPRT